MTTSHQRERVLPRLIEDEMRESFLDYSMSVIVQRALPDVRDGLKPVHRRILFAMHEAGLVPARPYKKSATVVGDVLGKYHPHGDTAVYDSLVRMVQDFSLRYPLVDGQGNFGSIDGDSAAAYRYTEARLAPLATEMLADIDKQTVDFAPNFDDRLTEPTVLPARVPNLLVNGSSGIAVGMSTNVPPHNLREVADAAIHLLENPDCTVDDLMRFIPGPDFPTGGIIMGVKGIRDAYEKGRGRVVMRARVYKESRRNGKEALVVTEIPYGTNKTRILEQIAELARTGKLSDVSDLRDESDRDGIRIVVEMKRGADPVKVLNGLFKWTGLQSTFGVISLALDGGVPRELGLKPLLERWRDHRIEVVVRRSRWELEKARDEAHVLEGLIVALRRIEEVIALIRGSRTRESAARKLEKELKLSTRQAEAILNMRLAKLTQLESREIRERLAVLEARIAELEAILASPELQVAAIRAELVELAEKYGDDRRTDIVATEKEFSLEDLLAEEEVVVTVTREGYVRHVPVQVYRKSRQRGRSVGGTDRHEGDFLQHVFTVSTADTLLFFTDDGRVHALAVGDVPEAGLSSRGKRVHQLVELPRRARLVSTVAVHEFREDRFVLFATAEGTVKRTPLDQYGRMRGGSAEALVLREGDRLVEVRVTDGGTEVVMGSGQGRAIRFPEADVPVMNRAAQGVRGMKLRAGETVVGMAAVREDARLVAVTARGQAKAVALDELPLQKRDGLGNALVPAGRVTGGLVALRERHEDEDLMAVTAVGRILRVAAASVPELDRAADPETVLTLSAHDRLVEVAPVAEPAPRARVASATAGEENEDEDGEETDTDREPESESGSDAEVSAEGEDAAEAAAPRTDAGAADDDELDLFE